MLLMERALKSLVLEWMRLSLCFWDFTGVSTHCSKIKQPTLTCEGKGRENHRID